MTWQGTTLPEQRRLVRDQIAATLPGADAAVPNSVLRVIADANALLSHHNLQYLEWLADQLMADTAEGLWLDRHGKIWVGGRKPATYASGIVNFTGDNGTVIPSGRIFTSSGDVQYITTQEVTIADGIVAVPMTAIDPGSQGNQDPGAFMSPQVATTGLNPSGIVFTMDGGISIESDDSLRDRILTRIRRPPHGGSASDYVKWAREVPGVTRAWARTEAGIGTVTVRFMMDDDRAPLGIPNDADVATVAAYIDARRPVSVKDVFVIAPRPYAQTIAVRWLARNTSTVRSAVEAALKRMYLRRASPGGTMFRSWVGEAVSNAAGEDHHELIYQTMDMPTPGDLPILEGIKWI